MKINDKFLFLIFLILLIQVSGILAMNENIGLSYGNSYIIGVGDGNNPRFEIANRIEVTDLKTNKIETLYSGMGMIGEDTFGNGNLILNPSYYFSITFGEKNNLFYRSYGFDISPSENTWERNLLLHRCEVTEINDSNIEYAIYNGKKIIGRTKIEYDSKIFLMEYPIRTINYNINNGNYQIDTGRIIFMPDNSIRYGYVLFNNSTQLTFTEIKYISWLKFINLNYFTKGKIYNAENKLYYLNC